MDIVKLLVTDSRFWLALYALVQAVLFYFMPDFPQMIWQAIDVFIVLVIGIITGQAVVTRARVARAARARMDARTQNQGR